jgi:hypothetical protein
MGIKYKIHFGGGGGGGGGGGEMLRSKIHTLINFIWNKEKLVEGAYYCTSSQEG